MFTSTYIAQMGVALILDIVGFSLLRYSSGFTKHVMYGVVGVITLYIAILIYGYATRTADLATMSIIMAASFMVGLAVSGAVFFNDPLPMHRIIGMAGITVFMVIAFYKEIGQEIGLL